MSAARLETLNPEQRRAVEHGGAPLGGRPRCWSSPAPGPARQHARPSRRASHRQRRRPAPDPADDVFAARRAEMTQRVERIARKVLGDNAGDHDRRADLGRHVSWHRRAAAARIRRADRTRSRLHHSRSRRLRRPDESRPARARFLEDRKPLSDQGHLPLHLFALRQRRDADRTRCSALLSLVRRLGGGAQGAVRAPMSRPSRSRTCSITTISCSTGRR